MGPLPTPFLFRRTAGRRGPGSPNMARRRPPLPRSTDVPGTHTRRGGHVKPPPFRYSSPTTVSEAVALLVEHADDDARVLAGGQSLVPLMNFRLAQPGRLIDLRRVAGLDVIRHDGEVLVIGAMVRQAVAERSPEVALTAPLPAGA